MSSFAEYLNLEVDSIFIPTPAEQPFAYIVTAILFVLAVYVAGDNKAKLPVLNPGSTNLDFIRNSKQLFLEGRKKFGEKPYLLNTYLGQAIIIPPTLIQEARNQPDLDFQFQASKDNHGHIPGFEGFRANPVLSKVVTTHITKAINKLTVPLSFETSLSLRDIITDSTEWTKHNPISILSPIVGQVSTRIFMGEVLCRSKEWRDVSTQYTLMAFKTVETLRAWPTHLRPFVHWFLPECQALRVALQKCVAVLEPILVARRAKKAAALADGETPPVFDDSIEWFSQEHSYYGAADASVDQIQLSLVAIHTTSDLLQETICNIARHPELFRPLREEIVRVIGEEGLTKQGLFKLKLMDSVLKETQRLKPIAISLFHRLATKDLTLSNGLVVRKGQRVWADTTHMFSKDSAYYNNAAEFDGFRYLKMRGTDMDHKANLVSTGPEHIGFGHGTHACPGRFFAANELKIILVHLLLKYDWKLPEGHDPRHIVIGTPMVANPESRILIRRRKEEFDIDALHVPQ